MNRDDLQKDHCQADADQIMKQNSLEEYMLYELGVDIARKNKQLNDLLKKYARMGLAIDDNGSYTL